MLTGFNDQLKCQADFHLMILNTAADNNMQHC